MAVSIDEARRTARLARLALEGGELEALAADLSAVLDHFESVAEFASAEPAPREPQSVYGDSSRRSAGTAEIRQDGSGDLRSDTVGVMLTPDDALRNAPASEDGQFSVPGFLPDEP